ncbi:MAG: hypothetical protein HY040_22685 [Planctomycetes bacterium]|nr:hypothetical protein [Planctomycetota bacterium]
MVRLLGGLVLWITTVYCGPKTRTGEGRGREGTGIYPELAVLGFSEGSSPALASRVARMTALLPSFQMARAELARDDVALNIKEVRRIALQQGKEVLRTRKRDLERYRAGRMPRGTELRGQRVGVAVDGGRVRTRVEVRKQKDKRTGKNRRHKFRTEWREPKLLIIFEMDNRGRMVRGSRPWIDGTFQGPDECIELLAMHLHRLGAANAKRVTFLSDGAPWIWERLEWVEKRVGLKSERVVKVLDWCHAVHHVSLALEALGLKATERKQLYRQLRGWLKAGQAYRVTAELSLLAEQYPPDAEVWTPIRYLEKHAQAGHMKYGQFRKLGVPIGSGAIESAVRRVVNLRLKGNGIMWLEENAEAMLVLRAAALTDRWDETLEHCRRRLAGDRRMDWQWQSPDMPSELNSGKPITPPRPQRQGRQAAERSAA